MLKTTLIHRKKSQSAISATQAIIGMIAVLGILLAIPIVMFPLSTGGRFIVTTSATLYSGTSTSANVQGTARLEVSLFDNHDATTIDSISLINASQSISNGGNVTVYQCTAMASCISVLTLKPGLAAETSTNFTSPSTAFYFSAKIIQNQAYNYLISFSDGEAVSGTLAAV